MVSRGSSTVSDLAHPKLASRVSASKWGVKSKLIWLLRRRWMWQAALLSASGHGETWTWWIVQTSTLSAHVWKLTTSAETDAEIRTKVRSELKRNMVDRKPYSECRHYGCGLGLKSGLISGPIRPHEPGTSVPAHIERGSKRVSADKIGISYRNVLRVLGYEDGYTSMLKTFRKLMIKNRKLFEVTWKHHRFFSRIVF